MSTREEALDQARKAYGEALAQADKAREEALLIPNWKFWERRSKKQIRQAHNDAIYRAGCKYEVARLNARRLPWKNPPERVIVKDVPWYNYGTLVGYADLETCDIEERQIGVCLSCKDTFWFISQPKCHCGCGEVPSHAKVLTIRKLDNKAEDRSLGPPPDWSGGEIEVQARKVYEEAAAQAEKLPE